MTETSAGTGAGRLSALAAGLFLLAGCAGSGEAPVGADEDQGEDQGEVEVARVYESFPPGAPQDCIPRDRIRSIDPVGNHTLLFYSQGGDVWRNRLHNRCLGLRQNSTFSYDVYTNRLCAGDIIYLMDNLGGDLRRGSGCALGEFDYLTEDQAAALKMYK